MISGLVIGSCPNAGSLSTTTTATAGSSSREISEGQYDAASRDHARKPRQRTRIAVRCLRPGLYTPLRWVLEFANHISCGTDLAVGRDPRGNCWTTTANIPLTASLFPAGEPFGTGRDLPDASGPALRRCPCSSVGMFTGYADRNRNWPLFHEHGVDADRRGRSGARSAANSISP